MRDSWLLGALLAALGLQASWFVFRWGPPDWQLAMGNVLYLIPAFLSVVLAWRAALRYQGRARLGWSLIALGLSADVMGGLLWAYTEVVLQQEPFPSLADAFYLLAPPLFALGVLRLPLTPLKVREGLRLALDVLIVVVSAGVYSWYFFLVPILRGYADEPLTLVTALAYPVSNLVLFSLLVFVALRHEGWRSNGLALLGGGLALFIAADISFALLSAAGLYVTGHPIDGLWAVGLALFALAARAGHRPPPQIREVRRPSAALFSLPYLAVLFSYALLALSLTALEHATTLSSLGVLWGTALATGLVVTRQVLALGDNARLSEDLQRLNDSLEGQVEERTELLRARSRELDQANAELLALSHNLEHKVRERTAELEASRATLAYQAQHDALTGLPNRMLFEDRLKLAVSAAARDGQLLAVFFIDLDGFKGINDTLGHLAGDVLLKELAQRLGSGLRNSDTVARLGGDEFVALATDLAQPEDASRLARNLLSALSKPYDLMGHTVKASASIGISLYPQDARDASALQRYADIAMYRAKQAGKNDVRFFSAEMNSAAPTRLETGLPLNGALLPETSRPA